MVPILALSAHLVRVGEINDLDVLVQEPVLHVGPSHPSTASSKQKEQVTVK